MSSDDEDSGIRGRIDRFFDRRAKEQQELISSALGGEIVEEKVTNKSKYAQDKKSEKIAKKLLIVLETIHLHLRLKLESVLDKANRSFSKYPTKSLSFLKII